MIDLLTLSIESGAGSAEQQLRAAYPRMRRVFSFKLNSATMVLDHTRLPQSQRTIFEDELFAYDGDLLLIKKPNASWLVFKLEN